MIVEHVNSEPAGAPEAAEAPEPAVRSSFVRWLVVFALCLGVIAFLGSRQLNEYSITPGHTEPVGPLIKVKGAGRDVPRRSILMTDVYLTRLTAFQWIWTEVFGGDHAQLISGDSLTDPGVPDSQLVAQGYLEMYDSQNNARAAALSALHYNVAAAHAGATVFAVPSSSPSSGKLEVADRIVAARGKPVSDVCSLVVAMAGVTAGRPVALLVEPAEISSTGKLTFGAATTVSVRTTAVPRGDADSGCPGAPPRTALLGIGLQDAIDWSFPVTVTITTSNIGGPSAGLAMTLGIIDALTRGSLTGHAKVAATGEIDPSGNVTEIGGITQKVISVERSGAKLFLVPVQNYAAARRAASGGLRVVAVSTLDQALRAIAAAGGNVPAT